MGRASYRIAWRGVMAWYFEMLPGTKWAGLGWAGLGYVLEGGRVAQEKQGMREVKGAELLCGT